MGNIEKLTPFTEDEIGSMPMLARGNLLGGNEVSSLEKLTPFTEDEIGSMPMLARGNLLGGQVVVENVESAESSYPQE